MTLAAALAVVALLSARPGPPAPLFVAALPGRPQASCAVADGLVVVGISHVEQGRGYGAWVGLDARTGAQRWHTPSRGIGVGASPVIAGDVVVVGNVSFGAVQGLDTKTGKVRWTLAGADSLSGTPLLDVLGRTTLWVPMVGALVGLDPATGVVHTRWPFEAGTAVLGADASRIYIEDMAKNLVVARDKLSGAELWQLMPPVVDAQRGVRAGFQVERAGLDDTSLYLTTNVAESWAVDVQTGKKRWGFEPDGSTFGVLLDVAPGDGDGLGWLVLASSPSTPHGAPSRRGVLQRFSARDGTTSWTRELPGAVWSIPVRAGGLIVVATEAALVAYGAGDGEERLRLPVREPSGTPCVGADGTVYVPHAKWKLTAVKLPAAAPGGGG